MSLNVLQRTVLNPLLDAQARNDEQHLALFDPSPEADSLIEHLSRLSRLKGEDRENVRAAMLLALRVGKSNRAERDYERTATGAADAMVREVNGPETMRSALSVKSIARALREPLRTISTHGGGASAVPFDATLSVARVIQRVPADLLLAPAVRRELGERKFAVLRSLVSQQPGIGSRGEVGAASKGGTR